MSAPSAITHLRNYASAGTIIALAGLVTFPLLTRSLSVAEYGIVGLVMSSLTFFIAIGKLGIQHSVIRFFSQVKNSTIEFSLGQMNSTVASLFFILASITAFAWLIVGYTILPSIIDDPHATKLVTIAAVLIFVRLLGSGVTNFLRAQQRSGIVAMVTLIMRCIYVGLIVLAVLLTDISPFFVIVSMFVAELVGVSYAARKYWPSFQFSVADVSTPLAKAMLLYGMPLMLLESFGLILRLSDRYLIGALLDDNALGMYSASYNFTAHLDVILLVALAQAVKPMYMEMWESSGSEKTQEFLSRGFHLFLVIGIPFVAVFSLVGPHLLNFLASPKYAPGAVIIPFVAISFLVEGSVHFLAAGLYIQKNTKVLMIWSLIASILNVLLNLVMIPKFGIVGAAGVTIVSYVVFTLGVSRHAFKYVSLDINWRMPTIVALVSIVVYFLGYQVSYGNDVASFIAKGLISTIALFMMVYCIDNPVRESVSLMKSRQALKQS